MSLLSTIIAFIVALSLLIVVHELGHYWAARLCNVKVLRFSLGMGKIIFSRRFGPDQTEWALSILPFGGYVKLLDASSDGSDEVSEEDQGREFNNQSAWRRFFIVVSGPLANFLLAIMLLAQLYMFGVPEPIARLYTVPENSIAYQAGLRGGEHIVSVNGIEANTWSDVRWNIAKAVIGKKPITLEAEPAVSHPQSNASARKYPLPIDDPSALNVEEDFMRIIGLIPAKSPAVVENLLPDGPAMKAGLQKGDRILNVDGVPVLSGLAFIEIMRMSPEKTLPIRVLRDGNEINLKLTPEILEENDQLIGRIQATISLMPEMVIVRHGLFSAMYKGVVKTWDTTVLTIKVIGKMITGDISIKNLTGPISIADYAGQTARAGIIRYLHFIVFISISIGVMNLLPIPVLDGGLLLYYAIEMVIGRPVSERFSQRAYRFGLAVLVILLAIATFNDLNRLLN